MTEPYDANEEQPAAGDATRIGPASGTPSGVGNDDVTRFGSTASPPPPAGNLGGQWPSSWPGAPTAQLPPAGAGNPGSAPAGAYDRDPGRHAGAFAAGAGPFGSPSGRPGPGSGFPHPPGPGGPGDPYGAGGQGSGPWSQGPGAPGRGGPDSWTTPSGYWTPPGHRAKPRYSAGAIAAATAAVFVVAGVAGLGVGRAIWDNSSSNAAAGSGNQPGTTIPVYGNGSGSNGSGSNGSNSNGSSGSNGGSSSNGGSNNNGFGTNPFGNNNGSGNGSTSGGSGSTGSGGPANTAAIAAKVSPGLVDINTTLGYQGEEAAGTGIVLTSSGLILTINHVITGATRISITDVGNSKTYPASVVGYDRTDDIAVLQLSGASGLQTATLGSSSGIALGQAVVGVGNAGGTGGVPSYAGGSVTALNQSITATDEGNGTSEQLTGLIQTNADIQPGDSGGALVNTAGQVIGVDTAASAGFSFQQQGTQGFAIPIDKAMSIVQQIRAGKASTTIHLGATPFLGIGLQPTNSANGNTQVGTTITTIIPGTPAAKLGLVAGDTITGIGGVSVNTGNDLTTAIDEHHPGDRISVSWTDTSGASHTADVTLVTGPAN
jgi:S1-C subfamily serine protease